VLDAHRMVSAVDAALELREVTLKLVGARAMNRPGIVAGFIP
jgi:hypothetical protein